jgi:large subunit ribosomal protein L9
MKIIFIKDLKGHGQKGEIKEVKDGFGQNFLIKNGYAVKATETSFKILEKENEETKKNHENKLKEANNLKEKLEKLELVFKVKAGSKDKVFGSISSKQIVEELKSKGYNIDKTMIHLKETLSTLGFHNVEIELHKQVKANLKVQLVKEGK